MARIGSLNCLITFGQVTLLGDGAGGWAQQSTTVQPSVWSNHSTRNVKSNKVVNNYPLMLVEHQFIIRYNDIVPQIDQYVIDDQQVTYDIIGIEELFENDKKRWWLVRCVKKLEVASNTGWNQNADGTTQNNNSPF